MEPEDWDAVSRIYLEGIATEHATFQTTCPPYAAWDASHTKDCRLVLLVNDVIAGWTALHRNFFDIRQVCDTIKHINKGTAQRPPLQNGGR